MPIETRFGKYPDELAKYIRPTKQLDYDVAAVRKKANELVRDCKSSLQAISNIWFFVSSLPHTATKETKTASAILRSGRADSNARTTLFTSLARHAKIPTRPYVWRLHKQATLVPNHAVSPKKFLFLYPQLFYRDQWKLLSTILTKKESPNWERCPFLDASNRKHPLKEEWIAEDLGPSWHIDTAIKKHGTNADGWRNLVFPFMQ